MLQYLKLRYGNGTQALAAATDVKVKETLNGQFYVSFSYPRQLDDLVRYNALVERNVVEFPPNLPDKAIAGQQFVIKTVTETRSGKQITKQVEAHHIAFDLNRYYLDDYVDFAANQPPSYPLGLLVSGTPYTINVSGAFTNNDIFEFGEKRKYELLSDIVKLYEAELSYNNYAISFVNRKGANYGVEIRYRKNLTGITRKSSEFDRVTRLYGYGKNGLTIEGYGGRAVKYIDSAHIDPAHIYEGSIEFSDIDDKGRLLAEMQKHLATVELPQVSYDIDFVQLEKVSAEFKAEAIREVGDTITVIDDDMGYRFSARVTEYERYPFEPLKARVTIANYVEQTAADYVTEALYSGQKAISYTSKNAILKGVKYDDSITLVDGLGMAVSDNLDRIRVRLGQVGAGEYGMTMYNTAGQRTIWQDAATGSARFRGNIEASMITGGSIVGSVLYGGEIYGAYIATRETGYPRIVLSETTNLLTAEYSATRSVSIDPVGLNSQYPKWSFKSDAYSSSIYDGGRVGLQIDSVAVAVNADLLVGGTSWIDSATSMQIGNTNMQSLLNDRVPRVEYETKIATIESRIRPLETAMSSKANSGVSTETAGPYNGGIPIGTRIAVEGGGYVTWAGIAAHSHTQV